MLLLPETDLWLPSRLWCELARERFGCLMRLAPRCGASTFEVVRVGTLTSLVELRPSR